MRAGALREAGPGVGTDSAGPPRIRVVIADDASAMRALVRRLLEDESAFDIVGEADDGEGAVRLVGALHPDLILLDISMPGMDGLTAIPTIRRHSPVTRIVVLSAIEAGRVRDQALAAGADDFIEKRLLSDSLARRLVEACRSPRGPDATRGDDEDALAGDGLAGHGSAGHGSAGNEVEETTADPAQHWFWMAFDNAPIGMAVLGLEGRFQRVNEVFCEVVGHPADHLVGAGTHEISHPADLERHVRLRAGLVGPIPPAEQSRPAATSFRTEHRFVGSDGRLAWTRLSCSLLRAADGSPVGFLWQLLDLTERTMADAATARAEELRERYEKELARSNADLAQFATVAAHDLKSPLQVISGFAGLLEQTQADVLDERGQEFLAYILKSATRMNVLIDDLLAYARVGADRRPPVAVSLNRVIDDIRIALAPAIAETGASIVCDPLPVLAGDPAQFLQLLSNLLDNGLTFVAEGVQPRIRISASRMVNAWCIDVVDNGVGIDPEHRTYVFGMFQRLRRDDLDGTGIGLAICKRIVEQRGGSIWVESNPQEGSRFRFTVPDELGALGPPGEPDVGPSAPGTEPPGGPEAGPAGRAVGTAAATLPSGGTHATPVPGGTSEAAEAGLDVLLVEDDDAHARLVAETLAASPDGDHRLRRVRDLASARLELARHPADCILLDLFLPDGHGLDSLSQLTTLEPWAPIVILTSLADEQLGLQAVHEGAQDYLVKGTVDGPRLSRALRHAVERKALEARFSEQALHDPLTGLANRTLLLDRVRLELARNGRTGTDVAVFYLDIHRFKAINDRWGRAGGDQVLVRVARRLSRSVRPGDTVGRIGGDEFVVVCGGIETEDELEQMRARIVEVLGRPLLLGAAVEVVTAAIGVAVGRADEDPEAVIRRADDARYQGNRTPARGLEP